jgi:hypothetical protein
MARTKGSPNKNSEGRPATSDLSTEQRLQLIANLIIDRIAYDQGHGNEFLEELQKALTCSLV